MAEARVEISMTAVAHRFAMEQRAEGLEGFVSALDDVAATVMEHQPSMAAGVAFARSLAVAMAEKLREQMEAQR